MRAASMDVYGVLSCFYRVTGGCVCVLLSSVKFVQCLKYKVVCVDMCIILMQIILTDSKDVIFF
jgi:hypothetical protein